MLCSPLHASHSILLVPPKHSPSCGVTMYIACLVAVFYQCKASNCLDYARVVQGDRHGLAEATVLLLYWAVQCRPNEHFIELIQALDEDMQLSIMGTIKKAAEQIDDQGALLHGNISICEWHGGCALWW